MGYRLAAWLEEIVNVCLLGLAFILARVPSRRRRGSRVLISRLDSIGDFILFTATLPSFRETFPGARLTLLVKEPVIELASDCPHVDEVWSINVREFRWNPFVRIRWCWRLARARFDVAIHAVYSTSFDYLACLVGWTYASRRIAYEHPNRPSRRKRGAYFSEFIPAELQAKFEIERNNDLIRYLGGKNCGHSTSLWNANEGADRIQRLLPGRIGGRLAIVSPGALNKLKIWPWERFVEVLHRIDERLHFRWILTGSHQEREVCNAIERACKTSAIDVTNLSGCTSLRDLAALVEKAELCIGNDSALMHIAAACGTPAVGILGGGHPGRFFPYPGDPLTIGVTNPLPCYHCDWNCVRDQPDCILGVEVDSVVEAVFELVSDKDATERHRA